MKSSKVNDIPRLYVTIDRKIPFDMSDSYKMISIFDGTRTKSDFHFLKVREEIFIIFQLDVYKVKGRRTFRHLRFRMIDCRGLEEDQSINSRDVEAILDGHVMDGYVVCNIIDISIGWRNWVHYVDTYYKSYTWISNQSSEWKLKIYWKYHSTKNIYICILLVYDKSNNKCLKKHQRIL